MTRQIGFTDAAIRGARVFLLAALWWAGIGARAAAPAAAPFAGEVRLALPPRLYAVPGIEMNVYFDNVCLVPDPGSLVFDVTCAKGRQQVERWTFVPEEGDAGEYPFVIEVRDAANAIIARAESRLRVAPRAAGAGAAVTVLTVGDSLTHATVYPAHLLELCKAEGNPHITLVGHTPHTNAPAVRIEGYGGWTAQRFATFHKKEGRGKGQLDWRAWNASGSPFLYADAQGVPALDFSRYCREFNGGKAPDFVTFLLGCNDLFGADDGSIDATLDAMFRHYDALIGMVRRVSPETRIGVLLVTPPAGTQDAFGANYRCGLTRWQFKRNQHRAVERMMERYGGREGENLFLVPVHLNLDCARNYPVLQGPWNARTREEGSRLNNGVHPSREGYLQIGDALFCWIKAQVAGTRAGHP
ncbi:MAG: SGNH/GDSL hydrolase family protein [Kiritimatiellia bacterium]|jgi:lysophospholipase L1-like esterase|nr:SGNH/GDSL hydrolase family protein [Kiritimatiellia bacterium]